MSGEVQAAAPKLGLDRPLVHFGSAGLLWANNMVAAGTPAELADRSEVREAYFG
jgi:hypothetical protein